MYPWCPLKSGVFIIKKFGKFEISNRSANFLIINNMSFLRVFSGFLGLMGLSASYSYGTKFERKITIDDKFERVSGNKDSVRQILSVSDTDNNIYKVTKSLWYWQWYSTETWNRLKRGETYNVKGYGIRFGPLSIYPNIISAEHIPKNDR